MRIAICDDEPIFARNLRQSLEHYYHSLDLIVDTFTSGEEFLTHHLKHPDAYSVIFMDIEMKQLDGLSTARRIRTYNQDTIIIFLTSHREFALTGYEVDAFRYLVKPLEEDKLTKTLLDVQQALEQNKRILCKEGDREYLIRQDDIVYFEAQNVNLYIRTLDGNFMIRKSLQQMMEDVQSTLFFQPHRSYLIHLKYVVDYTNKSVTMETGDSIPISRNRVAQFREALLNYMKVCGR